MPENMSCVEAPPAQLSQFALVSYIPDPLGGFLDRLRLELVPGCSPRAHVTVLPPRPITGEAGRAACHLQSLADGFHGFEVELGDVEMFPVSKVIYLSVVRGDRELRELYQAMNRGVVQYQEPFPYHPHSTLVQNVPPEKVPALFDIAQTRWSEYTGPRSFEVNGMDFVKNIEGSCWKDLASIELTER